MRKAENLPLTCAVVTKSGNLNFLEPSGPVQACNGTALTLYRTGKHLRSPASPAKKSDHHFTFSRMPKVTTLISMAASVFVFQSDHPGAQKDICVSVS